MAVVLLASLLVTMSGIVPSIVVGAETWPPEPITHRLLDYDWTPTKNPNLKFVSDPPIYLTPPPLALAAPSDARGSESFVGRTSKSFQGSPDDTHSTNDPQPLSHQSDAPRLLQHNAPPPPQSLEALPTPDIPTSTDQSPQPPPASTDPVSEEPKSSVPENVAPSVQTPLPMPPISASIPTDLVDAPVDRLALADNLFAAGESALALDTYAAIRIESLSHQERQWIQLQTAACYRRLGSRDEAVKRYRQLVTATDPVWVGDLARWWIRTLDADITTQQQANEIDAVILQWQEVLADEIRP